MRRPKTRAQQKRLASLRRLYARIPRIECKGLCDHDCTAISFEPIEQRHALDDGL